LASSIK